jgi:dihydropteroate synthase-like protein
MASTAHLQFVTGRLAAPALQRVVARLAAEHGFQYTIEVLPITVAALMTPEWIARRWQVAPEATQIILPGYCTGDLDCLRATTDTPIRIGPRDLHALPEFLGNQGADRTDYGAYSIEIFAEINHAPDLAPEQLVAQARQLAADGADVIDLGCRPGTTWQGVGDAVRRLRDCGLRVSIDSFDPQEIAAATRAGAELVLSVNHTNRDAAADWGCPVVAIPDDPEQLDSLDETVQRLQQTGVPYCLDPILSPIGFGFARSLLRYATVRQRYPHAEMFMGIGNLTELTDVDSAGVNVMLLACCAEWGIRRVLTTQVINWARSSVRECDLARRLVHYATAYQVLPKHLEPRLVMLRDPRVYELTDTELAELADSIRDANYRVFAAGDQLHLMAAGRYLRGSDPFALFEQLVQSQPKNIDALHAFYLGYELCKAKTALTLGKQYRQDEALTWGFLTVPEPHRGSGRSGKH